MKFSAILASLPFVSPLDWAPCFFSSSFFSSPPMFSERSSVSAYFSSLFPLQPVSTLSAVAVFSSVSSEVFFPARVGRVRIDDVFCPLGMFGVHVIALFSRVPSSIFIWREGMALLTIAFFFWRSLPLFGSLAFLLPFLSVSCAPPRSREIRPLEGT